MPKDRRRCRGDPSAVAGWRRVKLCDSRSRNAGRPIMRVTERFPRCHRTPPQPGGRIHHKTTYAPPAKLNFSVIQDRNLLFSWQTFFCSLFGRRMNRRFARVNCLPKSVCLGLRLCRAVPSVVNPTANLHPPNLVPEEPHTNAKNAYVCGPRCVAHCVMGSSGH